jgi:hypothetical protein
LALASTIRPWDGLNFDAPNLVSGGPGTGGARPHPLARLDGDKLEQVLEIVGQILGFLP